jgi:hypothetical protein
MNAIHFLHDNTRFVTNMEHKIDKGKDILVIIGYFPIVGYTVQFILLLLYYEAC